MRPRTGRPARWRSVCTESASASLARWDSPLKINAASSRESGRWRSMQVADRTVAARTLPDRGWDSNAYKSSYQGVEALDTFPTASALAEYRRTLLEET